MIFKWPSSQNAPPVARGRGALYSKPNLRYLEELVLKFLGYVGIGLLALSSVSGQCGRCGAGGGPPEPYPYYETHSSRTTPLSGFAFSPSGTDSAALTVRWQSAASTRFDPFTVAELILDYQFSSPVTVTGLEVNRGTPGGTSETVADAGIRPSSPIRIPAGKGTRSFLVTSNVRYELGAYALLRTDDNPAGRVIGALVPAAETVHLAPLAGIPGASGTASLVLTMGRDGSGVLRSAGARIEVRYRLPDSGTLFSPLTLTGLHIHSGAAGGSGPIVLDAGIGTPLAGVGGNTVVGHMALDTTVSSQAALVEDLLKNPANYYVDLHTNLNPNGVVRGQLAASDELILGYDYRTGIGGNVRANFVRNADGDPTAALLTVQFAVKDLAAGAQLTSLAFNNTVALAFRPALDNGVDTINGSGALYQRFTVDGTHAALWSILNGAARQSLPVTLNTQRRRLPDLGFRSVQQFSDESGHRRSPWLGQ